MKLLALAIGFMLVSAACTSSTEPSSARVTPTTVTAPTTEATTSTTTATPTTTSVTMTTLGLVESSDMIVEERPMSAEELERFFDDDEVPFVDCDEEVEVGAATWDYGPIDENSPPDRQPTDALKDALDDLNEGDDLREGDIGWLPPTGWIALIRAEGSFLFVLADESDRWIAYVTVSGDPNEGIWRQHKMVGCDPRHI